jgi:hypothetical protein
MTDRQRNFISRLVGEKVLPTDGPDAARTAYVTRFVAGAAAEPNVQQASRMIEWLLALPTREGAATAGGNDVQVEAGRYALVDTDGVVKFYVVDRPTDGKWAGYTFLSAQASDEKHPIRNRETKQRILAEIAADPMGALTRYGIELGRCGVCGRTLTDEMSRATGIGPDCAARLGVDRYTLVDRDDGVGAEDETLAQEALAEMEEEGRSEMDGEALAASGAPADPSRAMTWRQRKQAVREQQGGRRRTSSGYDPSTAPIPY